MYPPVDTIFFHPDRPSPRVSHFLDRVRARAVQADRPGHRRLPRWRAPPAHRRRRTRPRRGSSGRPAVSVDVPRPRHRRRDPRRVPRARCAVILPGEEDFGIVPVEAQACGRPVVALARGGALETVMHGRDRRARSHESTSASAAAALEQARCDAVRPGPHPRARRAVLARAPRRADARRDRRDAGRPAGTRW